MRGRSKTDWWGVCLEAPDPRALVEDLAPAVADALELGATLADFQAQDDVRVLLDPAGHPFCLYLDK